MTMTLVKSMPKRILLGLALTLSTLVCLPSFAKEFDIVIKNGRVIDPETQLDGLRNIGIIDNRIAEISIEALSGSHTIDASGLVVAPGFIDLHVHGMTNVEQEYQVRDGVTTALELEGGIPALRNWYASRQNKALINYGASVSWGHARFLAMQKYLGTLDQSEEAGSPFMQSVYESVSAEELPKMQSNILSELMEGGIGIGVPIGYYPKASALEDFRVYQLAGEKQIPIFSHVREGGTIAIQQAIANAMLNKAPLHIVHMNSMALSDIDLGIEMVHRAQQQGYAITTEVYPYTAASTWLDSALFDAGWQEALGISYGDLQWVETGERLTEETFAKYRKQGGIVIIHMMKPEWIASGIKSSGTVIASDGMPYAKLAHPRTAGTFSRVLGKYVREDKVLSLNEALEKMTLLPAKVLEDFVPSMKNKGRIQVGTDADITIFDPNTIIDKATFEQGLAFSTGVKYVLVSGQMVVAEGATVSDVFPGQAVYGKFRTSP